MNTRKNKRKHIIMPAIAMLALLLSLCAQSLPLLLQNAPKNISSLTVCTTYGLQTIEVDENGQKAPSPKQSHKHCKLCIIAGMEYQACEQDKATHTAQITYPTYRSKQTATVHIKATTRKALPIRAPPPIS